MGHVEVWLRGERVEGVPALLQPVAHGLLQCQEEVQATVAPLDGDRLWARPGGAASIGFHAVHAAGSLDRLLTYARGATLSPQQLAALKGEGGLERARPDAADVVAAFDAAIAHALEQLRRTDERTLLEPRRVGRAGLPSTVLGLLFHAAEHTQRHVGQLVTTAKFVTRETGS
jgi:DinB superfamily